MEKSRKDYVIDRVLDFIIYGSFLSVLIWALLKSFGVINTPVFVQQLPVITGTLGLLGFAYKIGRFVENVEQRFFHVEQRFQHIEQRIEQTFNHINMRLIHIDKDVEFLKQHV